MSTEDPNSEAGLAKNRALVNALALGHGDPRAAGHHMLLAEVRVMRAAAIALLPGGEPEYWNLVAKELSQ